MEKAQSKDMRSTLNDEAKRLVEDGGAFGAPWIVTVKNGGKETANWFGSDRTEVSIVAARGLRDISVRLAHFCLFSLPIANRCLAR